MFGITVFLVSQNALKLMESVGVHPYVTDHKPSVMTQSREVVDDVASSNEITLDNYAVINRRLTSKTRVLQDFALQYPNTESRVHTTTSPESMRITSHANMQIPSLVQNTSEDDASGSSNDYSVPNIVHFLFYDNIPRPMSFTEMVSVLSAYQKQKPTAIFIHCSAEPFGEWWLKLQKKTQQNVTVIQRDLPVLTQHNASNAKYHAMNQAKLEILLQYGGIVLESDVILVRSLNELRHYEIALGKEVSRKVSNAVILASRHSRFLRQWYDRYRTDFRSNSLEYNCCTLPYKMSLHYNGSLYVEPYKLTRPDWLHKQLLFTDNTDSNIISWKDLFVVHLMFANQRESSVYNPTYIKSLRNLIGKVLRYIYYGSPDERSDWLPWIYYSQHPLPQ